MTKWPHLFLSNCVSFNYKKESNKALFSKYLIVYTFNLFVGMGIFELVLIMSNIEELLVQAIVIIITAVSNFIGLRKFVFRWLKKLFTTGIKTLSFQF